MVVWREPLLVATVFVISTALHAHASNLTLNQKLTFDSLDNEEVRLRREAWAADDETVAKPDAQLKAFKADSQKTGSVIGSWSNYGGDLSPDMQMWQGGQLGSTATGQEQLGASGYPQAYGSLPGTANSNSPYAGYLEKQIASYPVMIYTLNGCEPCQRAKQLIATYYPDARAHYLELSGNENWQQQLQMDLMNLTGANTFPFIFVSGSYIGGFSELYELHENGQLRRMLNQSLAKMVPKH